VDELVGKKLKDFYVLRRLGRGAMAEVYLAQQLSLGRQVALKVLNTDLARDPNYVRRFHHEARAAAALVHAGIVQIYEVGQQDGIHYIAQEYVAGRNLGEVIRSRGAVDSRLALDILRQVTAALSKAAAEGIVHRDIKPENIMLSRTGEVKVADFGLARVQGDGAANLTQVGITMGTPLYMSPEQIEGRELDSRSDIYSLGVTAYHMLAGEPPFAGDSPLSVAVLHLNQPPVPLAERRPDLPSRLTTIVDRMLAKKPAERFADPATLLAELNAIANEGASAGWANRPSEWSLTEVIQAADDRAEATARLDDAMKTSALMQPPPTSHRWVAAALAGCVLLGVAAALLSRPTSLLAGSRHGPAMYSDVWKQLLHAKRVNTEEAWLAAEDPNNHANADPFYTPYLAKEGRAYFYLTRTQQYEKALEPLQELANLGESQPAFQVFGIAGLVVAYTHLGDIDRAAYENSRLTPEMRNLLREKSPQMADLLEETLALDPM
jgi:tRNA A-37 threonylcarbamoyl transferase component Bud32